MLQFDDNFKKIQEQVKWIEGTPGKNLKGLFSSCFQWSSQWHFAHQPEIIIVLEVALNIIKFIAKSANRENVAWIFHVFLDLAS